MHSPHVPKDLRRLLWQNSPIWFSHTRRNCRSPRGSQSAKTSALYSAYSLQISFIGTSHRLCTLCCYPAACSHGVQPSLSSIPQSAVLVPYLLSRRYHDHLLPVPFLSSIFGDTAEVLERSLPPACECCLAQSMCKSKHVHLLTNRHLVQFVNNHFTNTLELFLKSLRVFVFCNVFVLGDLCCDKNCCCSPRPPTSVQRQTSSTQRFKHCCYSPRPPSTQANGANR